MSHATAPTLHTDYSIPMIEDAELDGVHDTPLESVINILLPWHFIEIWLLFREDEGVDATIQVRVL